MKDCVDAQHRDQQAGFRKDRVQTKSQLYGSLWNNQLDGIHHSTSTSLTTKKHLTEWTEQHYGSFFDTTACLRR
uniref:Reverse transcriptase domain-containing protein n=1 Tax=Schistosoma curassoni TaxID=6186 RepID=A0A183L590_9TREM